ncbi:MAG TPA: TlpA disulfide reductase family protein [Caulifigura sp.]|nr:TlpA disulfide reductase family protein [Caulifigura sp.]
MPAPIPARLLSRRLRVTAVATLLASTPAFSQDKAPPKPNGTTSEQPAAEADKVDPFKLPEGNDPKELQAFLTRLGSTQPEQKSIPGRRQHLRKIEDLVDKVQDRELDEQTAMMAIDFRFQILQALERFGDESAAADRQKFAESLATSKLPRVVERGKVFVLAGRVQSLGELKGDARQKVIDDIAAYVQDGEITTERVELASAVPELLANQLGDLELAGKAADSFALAFEARKDDRLVDLIEQLRATGRRYGLVGNAMEVKGKTVDGKDFNLESLKGKVVLVDFWATWCGPCIQEMPHVRDLYTGYHSKGFEVVGISLDHKKEVLQSFLEAEKVPWIQLYADNEGNGGWGNPIAKHYGISAIPTAILIGKDGKVISLNAVGRELTRLLEKELGPRDEKAPAEGDKDAPKGN